MVAMMLKKRVALLLVIAAIAVAVSGCTGRTIVITWEPNPIKMHPGQERIEGTVTVKVQGFLSSLYIDTITLTAYDDQGEVHDDKKIKVKHTVPFFLPSVSRSEPVSLDISYDDVKDSKIRKLVIVVTGGDPATVEIDIELLEEEA